jgi:hypothetical protein
LLLADRGFCSYVVMALLEMLGVACLFRLHQARPQDLRVGIRLGQKDRLVVGSKPQQKPRYSSGSSIGYTFRPKKRPD